jgi:Leucine-rich repeat (LRR) protein
MSKIKEQVIAMAAVEEGEDPIDPKEFDKLVLDQVEIKNFSKEDQAYLEEFTEARFFGMNMCKLTSLENFPNLKTIIRLELNENHLKGTELKHLTGIEELSTLKLANNQISTFEEVEQLKTLTNLVNIDLQENPVQKLADYKTKMFEMFPELAVSYLECF